MSVEAGERVLPVVEIRPDRGWFDLDLEGLWRYRELLGVLIKRDVQVLYRQAALGAGWAIVQPLFAVFIFSVIFGYLVKMPSDGAPYPIFAFAAVLPWTYFAEGVRRTSTGLVDDAELIRKIYFPRLIMPLAKVITPLMDFSIAFGVLVIMMLAFGVPITAKLLVIPFLVLVAGLLALAVGLWLGPINVRFRDVKHTVPFLIQVWMYATPVVYPLSAIPESWRAWYALNPMVGVVEGFRWAVLDRGHPDFAVLGVSAAMIVALLLGGVVFFKRMERAFADLI